MEVSFSGGETLKEVMSRMKKVDLKIFFAHFYFLFLYSIFRTRVRVRVTRSHCHIAGHIR